MDRFFLRHVLHVSLDGPWPKLQYLRIGGIGFAERCAAYGLGYE